MPFTKIAAAGIGSTGSVVLQNLTVTGILTASGTVGFSSVVLNNVVGIDTITAAAVESAIESYELDDVSALTDGYRTTFPLTFNYDPVSITNPLKLLVTVNGIIQTTFINNPDDFPVLSAYDGYTIDTDGNIKFSESLPAGTNVMIRVIPGSLTRTKVKYYPFKPTNIVLG